MDNLKKQLKREVKEYKKFEEVSTNLKNEILSAIFMSEMGDWEKKFWAKISTFHIYEREAKMREEKIRKMKMWIALGDISNKPTKPGQITPTDIRKAKEYPIENLVEVNMGGFACCPFHNEKKPSLKVYNDNTWYCFGCGKGIDSIDFVMLRDGIDFISAVKKLI